MKVWLDDERPAPPGWKAATSVREAQQLLRDNVVEELSLDHDLGLDRPLGINLVLWMADTGYWPRTKPVVHSANPPGRDSMRAYIERYYPKEE